ncbi:FeGP cofactor biosynthesis guanylyltransferase HcgB family protein [Desulfurobacterium sp.]|uniref:FeGP cofactor biosynthesis guanylyltransferase HcgB family protein n=1 Tax=Desulfurobacterium sp. TaxID=2004706 RepID=UPI00260270C3|nr:FeGP cofactor biosynthesis guanylyltransferase HcgB family protein [Desulfurobacterium sp.]
MWRKSRSLFKKAFEESLNGIRKGDKPEETEALKKLLLDGKFGVVTDNHKKFSIFKNTLGMFGVKNVIQICVPTDIFDLEQMPSLSKALSGRYFGECDFYIARGRLGLPGSGALTILIDVYGNVISAVTSPPHHIHGLSLETALFFDVFRLLKRLGMVPVHKGITNRTRTVYSSFTVLDVAKKIAKKKAEVLKEFKGDSLLVIGGYLDGIFIAEYLKNNFREIFLYDKEKSVMALSPFNKPEREEFDVIIDLTGFGGIDVSRGQAGKFKGKVIISEEPSGLEALETEKKPDFFLKMDYRGKTSGTMTLTIHTVRKISVEIEKFNDVLYAVPNLFFAESLLFNAKSSRGFLDVMEIPAVTASVKNGGNFKANYFEDVLNGILQEMKFELAKF